MRVTSQLRSATNADSAFIVEMARHACIIEDWPLPEADSEDVQDLLPRCVLNRIKDPAQSL
jgi:hypothetical protein